MVDGLALPQRAFVDDELFVASDDSMLSLYSQSAPAFMPGQQTTLRQQVQCSGIGLHCGQLVNLTLKPAQPNTGIRFLRTDLDETSAWIDGTWDSVSDTTLCTTISNSAGAHIATIEHLMAALAAMGVDNAIVELDAPEPPAMDGSAEPFMFLIECAGVVSLPARRAVLRILKHVRVTEGEKFAALVPDNGCSVDVAIDFKSPAIGQQRIAVNLSGMRFKTDLARARTFGFAHEVAYMQSKGLALGGSLDNAVVIQDDAVINPSGLRYADEFVRHKALDAVGDLFIAGGPFWGRYIGNQAGHKLNNMLVRAVMDDPSAYEWTTADQNALHALELA
jgi:UDP-3-O-[3-hydroxymyristoyl] N-acetylglucosamine deacetylase